ncbi:MAG: peptidoglycan-binding domain-containing protein [Stagnimonas sp.]|nr:peptidoglycan-binding domain-containing protein [Stagnimonas sp.]
MSWLPALPLLLLWLASGSVRAETGALPLPEPPADARPGECYGLVYVPPGYSSRSERVEIAPAGERIEVVPAVYEWVEETRRLPAGRVRRIVTPAKFETIEETVAVPARRREVPVPASYRTVEERLPGEPRTVLKPGRGLPGQEDAAIFCLVEAPGSEQLIERRVLVRPAGSRTVTEPAGSKRIRRQKLIEPAVTEWVDAPARTVTRRVKQLVTPAGERRVPVPAQYAERVHRVLTTPGHAEWQPILCADNLSPSLLRELQRRLSDQGYYRGPIDGRLGGATAQAIRQFQTIEELPAGPLSAQTLQALGLTPAGNY